MKLNIIIPNHNGSNFLSPCLDSLRKQTFTDFKITVVDNNSSDNSLELLSAHYPEVHVIKLSSNTGFTGAANAGILSSATPYVMLLNNDTSVSPDCIKHLVDTISKDTHIFSVGANILTMDSPATIDTNGDYYSIFGYAFCHDQGAAPYARKSSSVFTNCGCAVIYRTALLKKTGPFDEHFFAYLEDVDLGFRARRLGFQNLHCPQAIVYHYGSGTTGQKYSAFKVYYSARNNIWLQRKNLTRFQHILHFPFTILGMLLKYFYFHKYNLHSIYRKGCYAGLKSIPSMTKPCAADFFRSEPWILYGSILYVIQYTKRKLNP